jgi:hypothetical protein
MLVGMAAGCGSARVVGGAESVTTVASPTQPTIPVTVRPGACSSGSVSLGTLLPETTRTVCLVSGKTLTVIFDKSPGSFGGAAGDWFPSPLLISGNGSALKLVSESVTSQTIRTVFEAAAPGTAEVSARFEVSCTGQDSPPCTIPPDGQIGLRVLVVADGAPGSSGWLTGELTMEGGPVTPGSESGQPLMRPVAGTVLFSSNGRRVATATVGSSGRFSEELAAGRTYGVQACTPSVQYVGPSGVATPSCGQAVQVTVQAGVTTKVDLPPLIVP